MAPLHKNHNIVEMILPQVYKIGRVEIVLIAVDNAGNENPRGLFLW